MSDTLTSQVTWLIQQREQLLAENAAMREIVEAVAHGETYHAEVIDVWVLLFDNPTLSYAQTIKMKARALLKEMAR